MSALLARKCCCDAEPPFFVCGGADLNQLPDTRTVTVSDSHVNRKLWWFYFRIPYSIFGCWWNPFGPMGAEGGTFPPGWFNAGGGCDGTIPGAPASSVQCFGGMLESRGYSETESSWSVTMELQKQFLALQLIPAYLGFIQGSRLYSGEALGSWSVNRDINELSSPTCTGQGGTTIDLGWPYNVGLAGPPCSDSGLVTVRLEIFCVEASRIGWFRDLCGNLLQPQDSLGHYYILRASVPELGQIEVPSCDPPELDSGIYAAPTSSALWRNTYVSMNGQVFGQYEPCAFVSPLDAATAPYPEWCGSQISWPIPVYCNGQDLTFGYGGQSSFGGGGTGNCATVIQDSHQGSVQI